MGTKKGGATRGKKGVQTGTGGGTTGREGGENWERREYEPREKQVETKTG